MKLIATFLGVALSLGASSAQTTTTTLRGASDRNLQSIAVTSLQLINTKTQTVVATIAPGASITVASGTPLSINATVSGTVGSVQFGFGGTARFRVESAAPYAFCGDSGGVFAACGVLIGGTHTVTATPFSATGATGTAGTASTRTFTIVFGSGPVPVPVPTPVAIPVPAPAPVPSVPTPSSLSTLSGWSGPSPTPVIAVAAAHLADGRVLMWSSKTRNDYRGTTNGVTWTAIYNPTTGGITEQLVSNVNHDMFCPGTTLLPNGVVMIAGGGNSEPTTFYDYRNNQWSVGPRMVRPRGYQAHTLLANGEVFTYGGSWSGGSSTDKAGEVWSPQTNSWRLLTGVPSQPAETADSGGQYRADNHYWLFTAPGGRIFHAGPSKQMNWITTSGTGSVVASIRRGDDADAMNGFAVMYDTGKILTLGGSENYASGAASNRAYIIDINGSEATVKRTANMQFARTLVNSVVLPNGEVVVIGGMNSARLFSDNGAVFQAEIWSPASETFRTLNTSMRIPRTYHSVALLLADGRVWAAGGGLCGDCSANHQDFEILTPPYLFNANGSLATRPSIQASPGTARAGNVIAVTMNVDTNHTFSLVKMSAVTHSVNNDQRRIPLGIVSKSGSTFSLQIPSNTNVALPGYYFLFAMNASGVPSVARTIRIDS